MALRRASIFVGKQAYGRALFASTHHLHTKWNLSASLLQSQSHPFLRSAEVPLFQTGHSIRGLSGTSIDSKNENSSPSSPEKWTIKMLYDGECPLCMREVNMLVERNKRFGTIKFVDISADDYRPEDNLGIDYETAMGKIHAILADGTVETNVKAFRKLYEAVGLGWVYAVTKYEPMATITGAIYDFWAKYRLPITGRPPFVQILEARKQKKGEVCDDSKVCKM